MALVNTACACCMWPLHDSPLSSLVSSFFLPFLFPCPSPIYIAWVIKFLCGVRIQRTRIYFAEFLHFFMRIYMRNAFARNAKSTSRRVNESSSQRVNESSHPSHPSHRWSYQVSTSSTSRHLLSLHAGKYVITLTVVESQVSSSRF